MRLGRDVPLGELLDDEDPTCLPLGQRPANAFPGNASSSCESEDSRPRSPRGAGRATSIWPALLPTDADDPAPMREDNSPSSHSNAAGRPGDSALEDALPARRARAASQMENDLAEDAAPLRNRFCTVRKGNRPVVGPAPDASNPEDGEHGFRDPIMSWPAYEASRPLRVGPIMSYPRFPRQPVYAFVF